LEPTGENLEHPLTHKRYLTVLLFQGLAFELQKEGFVKKRKSFEVIEPLGK